MAVRVRLVKSWTNTQGKVYAVGTILQLIPSLASELLADKIGEKYDGQYPPKQGRENKLKIKLSQLKPK